jgi:hypothetical protein
MDAHPQHRFQGHPICPGELGVWRVYRLGNSRHNSPHSGSNLVNNDIICHFSLAFPAAFPRARAITGR